MTANRPLRLLLISFIALVAGCQTANVDMEEPRRIVGTESNVRVDAQIPTENLSYSQRLVIRYDITNMRPNPIAVADIVPEATFDPETRMVTIAIGSEVPGERLVPRLIAIAPGEKKSFTSSTQVTINLPPSAGYSPFARPPNALRVKVNFLGDTEPFAKLLSMTEKAVDDRRLADELFPTWVQKNETVYTNVIPMRWGVAPPAPEEPAMPAPRRRRG